jgi:hypothetical protein
MTGLSLYIVSGTLSLKGRDIMDALTLTLVFEYREDDGMLTEYKRFDLDRDTAVACAGLIASVATGADEDVDLEFCLHDLISRHIACYKLPFDPFLDVETVLENMKFNSLSAAPPVGE